MRQSAQMDSFALPVGKQDRGEERGVGGWPGDSSGVSRVAPNRLDRELVPAGADWTEGLNLDDVPIGEAEKVVTLTFFIASDHAWPGHD